MNKILNSIIFLTITLLAVKCQEDEKIISFDIPDIATTIETADQHIHLEAYRYFKNDKILENFDKSRYGELTWVTLGHPTLIKSITPTYIGQPSSVATLFHETNEGIYFYIEMLTKSQRLELAKAAALKFGLNITANQIVHVQLSKFSCSLEISPNSNHDVVVYKGEVTNFQEYPLRLDFKAQKKTALKERLGTNMNDLDISLSCEVASPGSKTKTKIFTLTPSKLNEHQFIEKLFGPSNGKKDITATAHQIKQFASESYKFYHVAEEYGLEEETFKTLFFNELVSKLVSVHYIPANELITILSPYNIQNFEKKNQISDEIKNIFKLNNDKLEINSAELVKLKTLNKLTVKRNKPVSSSDPLDHFEEGDIVSLYGVFSLSYELIEASKNDFKNSTLTNQLSRLNNLHNDIVWSDTALEVRSIRGYEINRPFFSRKLIFSNIRKTVLEHSFSRKFSLYTKKSILQQTQPERIAALISEYDAKLNRTLRAYARPVGSDKPKIFSGSAELDGNPLDGNNYNKMTARRTISFPTRFKEIPQVMVSITALDMIPDVKVLCNVENLSTVGFDYVCTTFPLGRIVATRFQWIAIGHSLQ